MPQTRAKPPPAAASAWDVARYMAGVNPVFQHLGMTVEETRPGYALMRMHIRPDMGNTYAVAHGGIVFSFADMCFGVAANAYDERTVTASAQIDYLQPARVGADLFAEACEVWRGERSAVYDVTVRDADGNEIALMRVRGRILGGRVALPDGERHPELQPPSQKEGIS